MKRTNFDSPKWKLYSYLFLLGILLALASRFLVNLVGVFTPGLAGVAQGLTFTIWNISNHNGELIGMNYSQFVNTFYSIFYWLLNIPIIIFSFKKLGISFTSTSLFVLATNLLATIIISNIPFVVDIFTGENLLFIKESNNGVLEVLEYIAFPAISFIGGCSWGLICGLTYRTGSSTMGLDPISKYLEQEKSLNLNQTLFFISLLNSVFWIILIGSTSSEIDSISSFLKNTLLSSAMISEIIFLIGYLLVSERIYPSLRKLMIEIYSMKYMEILDFLNDSDLIQGSTIKRSTSGYLKKEFGTINIVLNDSEAGKIINAVKNIDNNSMISIIKLQKVFKN